MNAHEIYNPSFSDMNIAAQIDAGINDWCVRLHDGREVVGETKAKAEANAAAIVRSEQ